MGVSFIRLSLAPATLKLSLDVSSENQYGIDYLESGFYYPANSLKTRLCLRDNASFTSIVINTPLSEDGQARRRTSHQR